MSVHLVVPCFNESQRWNEDYWANMVSATETEFIFVDDGSTDGTNQLLAEFSNRTDAAFHGLQSNVGKAEAVRQGWLEILRTNDPGTVTAVGFIDADGAFAPEDVSDLIALASDPESRNTSDAWWSSRVALAGRNIQRNMRRHYLGRIVATYLSLGEPTIPYDTQSGLKLFDLSEYFIQLLQVPFVTRWLFEIEILARFQGIAARPMRIWEMPLNYWVDVHGSKVTTRESMRIALELTRLKRIQRRSRTRTIKVV